MMRRLTSATVRRALAMRKHVLKLLSHQRDILSANAISEVEAAMAELKAVAAQNVEKSVVQKQMDSLEKTANKWLKPYPLAGIRENVEMLLVALAVAMAIRTFFLQPFKIPTGSMQPTLYGVTSTPDYFMGYLALNNPAAAPFIAEQKANTDALTIPSGLARFKDFLHGISYLHITADEDGTFDGASAPFRFLIFNIRETYGFAGKTHTIWFPPDYGSQQDLSPLAHHDVSALEARAGIQRGQFFHKGEDIVKMKVNSGDYLFVDRLTYNFRPPQRGEIIVFQTKGIPEEQRERLNIPADQFYIKRLVGLGGETLQIGDDRHVVVDGHRLDATTPHFENVYSFDTNQPPMESRYSGHVNNLYGTAYMRSGESLTIPKDDFVVMGDNTMVSQDSRFWGTFPQSAVIGRYCVVYWPLTSRWGWNNR
jgi:signal peptidase I